MIRNKVQHQRQRGAALLWVALVVTVLIGMLGLAVDAGYLMYSGHQLQNAADAAVLGAIQKFDDPSAARTLAVDVAATEWAAGAVVTLDRNDDNEADGDIVFIQYDRATGTYSTDTPWNAIKVTARRVTASPAGRVKLLFGPMFGVNTAAEERYAIAMLVGETGNGAIVLDPSAKHALTLKGNGALAVNGGGVQVDSSDGAAAFTNDASNTIQASPLNVVGGVDLKSGTFTGTLHTGADYVADPVAGVPEPSTAGLTKNNSPITSGNYQPGWYPKGINIANNKSVTLAPGVYILGSSGPGGFNMSGNSVLTGNGVTLFLASGGVNVGSGTTVTLSPPTSGTYANLTIFQSRSNATANTINGGGTLNMTGTTYFPNASLTLTGNGSGFGNQLIAKTLTISGNASIHYTGAFPTTGSSRNIALVK